jgi:hypothetical protein
MKAHASGQSNVPAGRNSNSEKIKKVKINLKNNTIMNLILAI